MAVAGDITQNEDGTIRWTARRSCMMCGVPVAVDRLDPEAVARWRAGAFAQDAFPGMSAAEREALISGTHARCFAQLAPADEGDDDEDGNLPCFICGKPADGYCAICDKPACDEHGRRKDYDLYCQVCAPVPEA
jgi:hypothetical protein